MASRGIRNNNPGNIDRSAVKWQGMADDQSSDPRFIVFKSPEFGIRALAKVLLTYQNHDGCKTVRQIIGRWAPPIENNTGAYVAAVAAGCGVGPDNEIDVDTASIMSPMVKAIILHENGQNPYSDTVITEGIRLAGVADAKPPPLMTQRPVQAQAGAAGALTVAGAVHYIPQVLAQAGQAAPTVKGWADQLGAYTSVPLVQQAVSALLTVAAGLTVAGIVYAVINHRRSA